MYNRSNFLFDVYLLETYSSVKKIPLKKKKADIVNISIKSRIDIGLKIDLLAIVDMKI